MTIWMPLIFVSRSQELDSAPSWVQYKLKSNGTLVMHGKFEDATCCEVSSKNLVFDLFFCFQQKINSTWEFPWACLP